MSLSIQTESPPITPWDDGSVRVGKTRLLIDLVIHEFNRGWTPEQIHEAFEAATVAEIYGVIAYYLTHRAEVDAYLAERAQRGEETRQKIESGQAETWSAIRGRLVARRDAQDQQ